MRFPLPVTTPPAGSSYVWNGEFTDEQRSFLDEHGFIRFRNFASADEVEMIREELAIVQAQWIAEGRETVNGIPIKYGVDDQGNKFVNRFAFTSLFSEKMTAWFGDARRNAGAQQQKQQELLRRRANDVKKTRAIEDARRNAAAQQQKLLRKRGDDAKKARKLAPRNKKR